MNCYCQPDGCDCRDLGYSQGKDAAYSELDAHLMMPAHARDCSCRPCLVVRAILTLYARAVSDGTTFEHSRREAVRAFYAGR